MPGKAADQGQILLANVAFNVLFRVWVDAELVAETHSCSVGPFTCGLAGFVLKNCPKGSSSIMVGAASP